MVNKSNGVIKMKFVWMDINLQEPPKTISGNEYFVTAYCKLWNDPVQTKMMIWDVEYHNGIKTWIWKINGVKCSPSVEITHWGKKPEPAWKIDKQI
jgi:hypothetical protein